MNQTDDEPIQRSKSLAGIANALLWVMIILGATYLAYTVYLTIPLEQAWRAQLAAAGNLAGPRAGQVTIRTVSGDRPNHWKVHICSGSDYSANLFAATGKFHPSEMKAGNPFQCVSRFTYRAQNPQIKDPYHEFDNTGYYKRELYGPPATPTELSENNTNESRAALKIARGLFVTLDVYVQQRANGTWNVDMRGALFADANVETGGLSVDSEEIRFAGQQSTALFDAEEPIRLVEIALERSSAATDSTPSGICLYLVPSTLDITAVKADLPFLPSGQE